MRLLAVLIFCGINSNLLGQELHSPAEMSDIMNKSTIEYKVVQLGQRIPYSDRNKTLNTNAVYISRINGKKKVQTYRLDSKIKTLMIAAEKSIIKKQYKKALKKYTEAYNLDTTYYQALTFIGHMNMILRKYDLAEKYLRLAIKKNSIDYMAHWFLADIYNKTNRKRAALEEITLAQILNRNNLRIAASLRSIYSNNNLNSPTWFFHPQYQINKVTDKAIEIKTSIDWIPYAIAKALWTYEPGYREKMIKGQHAPRAFEEYECISGVILSEEDKTKTEQQKSPPSIQAMLKAYNNDFLTEYILYEIMLPQNPAYAYFFSKKQLNKVKKYILKTRGELK